MTEAPRLRRARIAASASFVAYVAVIVGANWMIGHVGTPIPGAHVLPVGFGLEAPSGVYLAALAFVARDVLQRVGGARAGVAAILVGAGISAFVASAHLALASGATFLLSETCDFLIYTPLQKRNFPLAVVASGVVGDLVDSTVFLTLAGFPPLWCSCQRPWMNAHSGSRHEAHDSTV